MIIPEVFGAFVHKRERIQVFVCTWKRMIMIGAVEQLKTLNWWRSLIRVLNVWKRSHFISVKLNDVNEIKLIQRFVCSFLIKSLRKKCPYSKFFWSVFSQFWTEYKKIRSISPYSRKYGIREFEKIRTKKTPNADTFHSANIQAEYCCHSF